jgi:hypothetical protein
MKAKPVVCRLMYTLLDQYKSEHQAAVACPRTLTLHMCGVVQHAVTCQTDIQPYTDLSAT